MFETEFRAAKDEYIGADVAPDLAKLAEDHNLPAGDLYRLAVSQNWMRARELAKAIVPKNVDPAEAERQRTLDRLDGHIRGLLDYLDEQLAAKALAGRDAVGYLKVLTQWQLALTKKTQSDAAPLVGGTVEDLLTNIAAKAAMLTALANKEKPTTVIKMKQNQRTQIFEQLDSPC